MDLRITNNRSEFVHGDTLAVHGPEVFSFISNEMATHDGADEPQQIGRNIVAGASSPGHILYGEKASAIANLACYTAGLSAETINGNLFCTVRGS